MRSAFAHSHAVPLLAQWAMWQQFAPYVLVPPTSPTFVVPVLVRPGMPQDVRQCLQDAFPEQPLEDNDVVFLHPGMPTATAKGWLRRWWADVPKDGDVWATLQNAWGDETEAPPECWWRRLEDRDWSLQPLLAGMERSCHQPLHPDSCKGIGMGTYLSLYQ